MESVNFIFIVGRLVRDPEVKSFASGTSLCNFTIASDDRVRNDQTGEFEKKALFINVDVWGNLIEECKKRLKKGSSVSVQGRLRFAQYKKKDGSQGEIHSIVAEKIIFMDQPEEQMSDELGF